jgi:hypothetical protein
VKSKYSFYAVLFVFVLGLGVFHFAGIDRSTTKAAGLTSNQVYEKLTFAEEYSVSGYSRNFFQHWVDADKDCLNTRHEVLKRDSRLSTRGRCTITYGSWVSWVDGKKFTNPRLMDVDHLVPLAEAWRSGASSWTATQRRAYANDLGYKWSLQAISLSVNRSKGDKDVGEWLPRSSTQCAYVQRWMAVKYRWSLSIDFLESTAIEDVLAGTCGEKSMALPSRISGIPDPADEVQIPDAAPDTTSPANFQDDEITIAPYISPTPATNPPTTTTVVITTAPPTTAVQTVYPGAYCSVEGATGIAANGWTYTCKTSTTDDRLRWRQ